MSYEEEVACVSYEEEVTRVSYEEEVACEEVACVSSSLRPGSTSVQHKEEVTG